MKLWNITYHPDNGPKESHDYYVSNCDLLTNGRIGAVLQGSRTQAARDFDFDQGAYTTGEIERKLAYPTLRKRGENGRKCYGRLDNGV